jgi:uncharacterized protein YciI
MTAFFCKLVPPRPTFASDMTEHEASLMQDHARYWTAGIAQGRVVVFGLVGDPNGAYGVGIAEFPDEAAVQAFTGDDPVIRARAGFRYEILVMPLGAGHR